MEPGGDAAFRRHCYFRGHRLADVADADMVQHDLRRIFFRGNSRGGLGDVDPFGDMLAGDRAAGSGNHRGALSRFREIAAYFRGVLLFLAALR